jgi:hypothetical protein
MGSQNYIPPVAIYIETNNNNNNKTTVIILASIKLYEEGKRATLNGVVYISNKL